MTEQTWGDLYTGGDRESITAGTHKVKVEAVRENAASSTLFLDLRVLDGPEIGKLAQISLFVPKPGAKATFYFQKKVAGFSTKESVVEAYKVAGSADDIETMVGVIGNNIVEQIVVADISVRGQDAGDYAGSNELVATRPAEASAPAPAAPAAAPAPAPAPAPAAAGNGNGAGADEDIEALRARLAAAEAAKPAADPVAEASVAVAGEEPF